MNISLGVDVDLHLSRSATSKTLIVYFGYRLHIVKFHEERYWQKVMSLFLWSIKALA